MNAPDSPGEGRACCGSPAATRGKFLVLLVAGLLVLGAGALLIIIYSGIYNVAATAPHWTPIHYALRTTMERSVRHHAAATEIPAGVSLHEREYATRYYGHYNAACVTCHSAPGVPADPWMINYPPSPDLTDPAVVERWSDAELFWIIKHGIKDTAMIALGPTHQEEDIWGVAALVRQLPRMTAEDYRKMGERFEAMQQEKNSAEEQPQSDPGQ